MARVLMPAETHLTIGGLCALMNRGGTLGKTNATASRGANAVLNRLQAHRRPAHNVMSLTNPSPAEQSNTSKCRGSLTAPHDPEQYLKRIDEPEAATPSIGVTTIAAREVRPCSRGAAE
ncbi:MAG TPA: hypothetical protein VF136_17140 [Methylomirabilota bacterium]